MKVKYYKFNTYGYAVAADQYPEEISTKDFTQIGTGEVIQFVKGGLLSNNKFIICDDVTKKFIEVDINDCIKIEDE